MKIDFVIRGLLGMAIVAILEALLGHFGSIAIDKAYLLDTASDFGLIILLFLVLSTFTHGAFLPSVAVFIGTLIHLGLMWLALNQGFDNFVKPLYQGGAAVIYCLAALAVVGVRKSIENNE